MSVLFILASITMANFFLMVPVSGLFPPNLIGSSFGVDAIFPQDKAEDKKGPGTQNTLVVLTWMDRRIGK